MKHQLSAAAPASDLRLDLDLDLELAGPTLEITDFHGASPGWERDPRLLIVIGAVAVIVAFATISSARGAMPGIVAAPARAAAPASVAPGTVAGDRAPTNDLDGASIASPTSGVTVRGSTVLVTGQAQQAGPTTFAVRLGRADLGRVEVDLAPGAYSVTLPVHSPVTPLTVDVVMTSGVGDNPITMATRSFVLAAASPVDAWTVEVADRPGACRAAIQGVAPLTVSSVSVALVAGTEILATDTVPVQTSLTPGAELLRQGEWASDLTWRPMPAAIIPGAGTFAGAQVGPRLELTWHDPVDGTTSTRSIPVTACGS
jgi:hypothetical protein